MDVRLRAFGQDGKRALDGRLETVAPGRTLAFEDPSTEPFGETGHDGWWAMALFQDVAGGTWSLNLHHELTRKSRPHRRKLWGNNEVKRFSLLEEYNLPPDDRFEWQ